MRKWDIRGCQCRSMWLQAHGNHSLITFAEDGDHTEEGYAPVIRRSARLAGLPPDYDSLSHSPATISINEDPAAAHTCDAPHAHTNTSDDFTDSDTAGDGALDAPHLGSTAARDPPHSTRRQQRQRLRQQRFHERREKEKREYKARQSTGQRAKGARGYAGNRVSGQPPEEGMIEIPMGDGCVRPAACSAQCLSSPYSAAVSVFDAEGRKTVHRANRCQRADVLHACHEAARLVQGDRMKPTFNNTQSRGNFKTYYFSLHRGSTALPRFSKDIEENRDLYDRLTDVLKPLMRYVEGIFKAEFPQLYKRYADAMADIKKMHPELDACFSPFASFCINISETGVVTVKHIDMQNLAPGLCVVIPFGDFDPALDCKLHVVELGYTFQVAAGTPIFFPSALYTHYNSALISKGMRGSIVAWTGASIFQYVDLGCRAVKHLSKSEAAEYKAGLENRVKEGLGLFPKMKTRPADLGAK
ncbi:unnamed protein product [Mycena citricolor]|uniref:Uncharacterized protein n=1 Tax=Mycena citricolor TaxID=2018698 RepID=A0AAD2HZG0_9AGAR|nr:unnamed protein product [Mycena citricolor]